VSTESEKKASLLGPLASAYEPTDADADRVFAKIQASLAAAPVAPVAAPPTPPAPPAASPGFGAGRTTFIAGALCALALVGGVVAWQARSEAPPAAAPSAPVSTAAVIAPVEAPPVVTAPTPPVLPSISVESLPSANIARPPASAPAKPSEPASAEANPPTSETLEKEARLLAEARRAVQRGDAAQGLALLDEHARTFPNGFLASDRAAEHIVVLCGLGRHDEAVREAKTFLAGRPEGPLTRRVTMSCAGDK
jgi:hypothetical protein